MHVRTQSCTHGYLTRCTRQHLTKYLTRDALPPRNQGCKGPSWPEKEPAATELAPLAEAAKLPEVVGVRGLARDGEEAPLAGHALELVSAAVFELES
jgi:hypothetical protein